MVEKGKLSYLGYSSLLEALAERFHASPALLQQLNPGITFAAGVEIQVPNVEPMVIPAPKRRRSRQTTAEGTRRQAEKPRRTDAARRAGSVATGRPSQTGRRRDGRQGRRRR